MAKFTQILLASFLLLAVSAIRSPRYSLIDNPIKWYRNCSGEDAVGSVKLLALTNCVGLYDCPLTARELQRIFLTFQAGTNHTALGYELSLRSTSTGDVVFQDIGDGFETVEGGLEYSFGVNFVVDGTVPPDTYSLRFHRADPGSRDTELCVEFDVQVVNDDVEAPTTEYTTPVGNITTAPPDTTVNTTEPVTIETTTEPATTVNTTESATTANTTTTTTAPPSPGYNCTVPGTFPDPISCTIFHVCQYFDNGTIWDQQLQCPATLVFCPRSGDCEFEINCPCDRSGSPFLLW